MNLRKLLLYLHLVIGLLAAIDLVLQGVTGSILAFEAELHAALNSKWMKVQPQGARLSVVELVEKLEAAKPGSRVGMLIISPYESIATVVALRPPVGKSTNLFVNPFTAEILGAQSGANNFVPTVRAFHKNLTLGPKGRIFTGWLAGLLIVLAITGIILWWRQKLCKVSGTPGVFKIHNVVGIYASAFMLVFAITGFGIHWEQGTKKLVNRILGVKETAELKPSTPAAGTPLLNIAQIAAIALKDRPGAEIAFLDWPGDARRLVRVNLRYPADFTTFRAFTLLLDPFTGEVLLEEKRYAATKLLNLDLHTGAILGWPTRIISLLAALSLPVLAITGPLIWWRRLRRKQAAD